MAQFTRRQIILLAAGGLILIIAFFGIRAGLRRASPPKVSLNVWGTDDGEVWRPIVEAYQKLRPNVAVNYTQVEAAGYNATLLRALAAGQGPDVVYVASHDVDTSILSPAPASSYSINKLHSDFPQTVWQDFSFNQKVYALPLYIDTLALLYNRDLFDRAGIVEPPHTWRDVANITPALRNINSQGQVVRAAAALGGSAKSVDNAPDILELLMLQNGTQMLENNNANFAADARGANAFKFYTDFANPNSQSYTWNDAKQFSLDDFAAGTTAMLVDYYGAIAAVRAKNPYINLGVAAAPQVNVDSAVSFANYQGLAVPRQSQAAAWAWDFILNVATSPALAQKYANASGHPPALLGLISNNEKEGELAVFARQALTARSWDAAGHIRIKQALNDAIQQVSSGRASADDALKQAESRVTQILRGN